MSPVGEQQVTSRLCLMSLVVTFLLGCEKQPERANQEPSSPERAAILESAEVGDRSAPEGAPIPYRSGPSKFEDDTRSFWEIEEEREREAILLATSLPKTMCEEDPSATYFFTLMGGNSVDNCGRRDPKVNAAFKALMTGATAAENPDPAIPSLSNRLLSGPSDPGEPYSIDGQTWWYYTACQAHDCGCTHLAILYHPADSRMVGQLTARREVHWLGSPNTWQRKLLDAINPVKALVLKPSAFCEDR